MGALDELLAAWRANPDAGATLALAAFLGESGAPDLVREVGERAQAWHSADAEVMTAVGRMYLDAGFLPEAQAALVAAGKADARHAGAYRYLGEVLLRRGDAARAEKILARAIQLGASDEETRLWRDRAKLYEPLQKRGGPQAVSAEVARLAAASTAPILPQDSFPGEEIPTQPKGQVVVPTGAPPRAPALPSLGAPPLAKALAPTRAPGPVPRAVPPPAPAPSPAAAPGPLRPRSAPPPLPAGSAFEVPRAAAAPQPAHDAWQPPPATPFVAAAADPPPVPATPLTSHPLAPSFDPSRAAPPVPAIRPSISDDPQPGAALVLEHLARVGVYEPGGGAPPAWEAAPAQRARGTWVFVAAIVLVLGAGGGGFAYARHVQAQRVAEAAALAAEVKSALETGEPEALRKTDEKLSRVFELDSRSQAAAHLWLQNRVLGLLLLPEETRGIDSAFQRARQVEIPEEEVIYAKVASFLAEGDLAGAAALLPRWDPRAGKNAWYQLVTGAALERAGDARALERYQAAAALDERLVVPSLLLAALAVLELPPEKSGPLVEAARKKLGEGVAGRALAGLAWACDPHRGVEPPAGAKLTREERGLLPVPLAAAPLLVDAALAQDQGDHDALVSALSLAVDASHTPALAARVGFFAVDVGETDLARRAALRAVQFSALYPGARALAARVALLGGRLEEAQKAVEELDPKSVEVAVVRAVVAYEVQDGPAVSAALEPFGATPPPALAALALGPRVIDGTAPAVDVAKLEDLAQPGSPWGELIAVDLALHRGDLSTAEKLVAAWGKRSEQGPHALRLARLRRYQGKKEEAAAASQRALATGQATLPVVVERVASLVAAGQGKEALEVVTRHPSVLGPQAAWLRMLVDASSGKAAEAKVKASQAEPPPAEAPFLLRLLAARGLAAAGDRRAKDLAKELRRLAPRHPDVVALP